MNPKTAIVSLAQQFLLTTLGLTGLSATDAQGRISDGNLYIKTEITAAGGIKDLIDSSTLEKIGTSSFDKQRLPTGCKMAIERIRFSAAVVDATDTNTAAAQTYTNTYGSFPAKLRAAHFIIARSGKKILEIPVSQLLTLSNVQGLVGEDDCYYLDAYRALQGDEPLNIQIQFPDNVDWPASKKIFVSVELLGPRVQY